MDSAEKPKVKTEKKPAAIDRAAIDRKAISVIISRKLGIGSFVAESISQRLSEDQCGYIKPDSTLLEITQIINNKDDKSA